ncbi:hypothetical protein V8C44DRAFT_357340 [Trichoderma aethiopicum]
MAFSVNFKILSILSLTSFLQTSTAAQIFQQSCINNPCTAKRITISNPPINLCDANLITSFNTFINTLQDPKDTTKVVVFTSANPEFWASTLYFTQLSTPGPLLLTTPVIFIGEVNGRAWGAGDEHLLRVDMRFASPEAHFAASVPPKPP